MSFLDSVIGRRIFSMAPVWRLAGTNGGEGQGEDAQGAPRGELPLSGRKVIVVEDEFFVGIELAQILETAGAKILGPASSLADARELAADEEVDMAVIDVNLNGEYSIDFAVELQQRGVRVVFATAYADDARLFTGAAASIPRLGKPTSKRALFRALLPDA
ncbi:response regulator [Parvibaculum sp.]|jgi:two-component system, response regulator PdtaR|uniref:response regulator n=1 Tax=Parvibaculum sp. TaxID=2024848 RepID=UPI003297F21D